jgi:hypothetical protein
LGFVSSVALAAGTAVAAWEAPRPESRSLHLGVMRYCDGVKFDFWRISQSARKRILNVRLNLRNKKREMLQWKNAPTSNDWAGLNRPEPA